MMRGFVMGAAAGAAAVGAAAGVIAGRRMRSEWGVEPGEAERVLPGDDLVAEPDAVDTRGIDIDATPEQVWPWLVQMGYGRGGWYSYDALDMDQPSAQAIDPRWQDLAVGDLMPTHPEGGFVVTVLDAPHALVLHLDRATVEAQEQAAAQATGEGAAEGQGTADAAEGQGTGDASDAPPEAGRSTGEPDRPPATGNIKATGAFLELAVSGEFAASWAFVLEPRPAGGSRLIERFRVRMEGPAAGSPMERAARAVLGIGVFVMVRRQLLGIAERASRDA